IERVDMSAASVQHATDIALGVDYTADRLGIEQFELVMAVTLPELFLLLQLPELSSIHGGKDTAILQVAVDAIALDAVTDDASALKSHFAQQAGMFRADLFFNGIQITAVTVDDLTAIAPGRTEPDPGSFQHGHPESVFQQEQGRGDAGIAATDHT